MQKKKHLQLEKSTITATLRGSYTVTHIKKKNFPGKREKTCTEMQDNNTTKKVGIIIKTCESPPQKKKEEEGLVGGGYLTHQRGH
jgi:hypothetical protein